MAPATTSRAGAQRRCHHANGGARSLVRAQIAKKTHSFQDEFYEIGQQLEALKVKLEGGSGGGSAPAAASSSGKSQSQLEVNALGYNCDENGCVLVIADAAPVTLSVDEDSTLDELLEGPTWSLGMLGESDGQGYCATVGGSGWSIGLTAIELKDFVVSLKALREGVRKLSEAAVTSEGIRVKWDTKTVKLEAIVGEGTASATDHFELHFQVGGLRLVCGSWSSSVVGQVLQALDGHVQGFAPGTAPSPPAGAAAGAPAAAAASARVPAGSHA